MKKVLAIVLALAMVFAFAACGTEKEVEKVATYQFGMGVSNSVSATSATAEKSGNAEVDPTVAIILVDEAGKIVKCHFDVAQESLAIDAAGVIADVPETWQTKQEKKSNYGMTKASTIGKDWYEQADFLAEKLVGCTKDEVATKISADENDKSTNADILAGCTMGHMGSFIEAIENAYANLEDCGTAQDIQLGFNTTISATNAQSLEFDVYIAGKAVDADGKYAAIQIDCSQLKFTISETGEVTAPTDLRSKVQKGADYGMTKSSTIGKDWFEQAEYLGEKLEGKTASEISGLAIDENGKATDADILSGCTMGHMADIIKAVVANAQ